MVGYRHEQGTLVKPRRGAFLCAFDEVKDESTMHHHRLTELLPLCRLWDGRLCE